MGPKRLVAEAYDRVHERYAAWGAGGDSLRLRRIEDALRFVPDGARVLDLGCGTGAHATAYLAERFSVVGVDISPRSVTAARLRLPGTHFVVADMPPSSSAPRPSTLSPPSSP